MKIVYTSTSTCRLSMQKKTDHMFLHARNKEIPFQRYTRIALRRFSLLLYFDFPTAGLSSRTV